MVKKINNHLGAHLSPRIAELFQPSSVRGWTWAFLLDVHRLWGASEGRLSHRLPRWFRKGWQRVTSWQKSLEILCRSVKPEPRGGQTVRYVHSPTELS